MEHQATLSMNYSYSVNPALLSTSSADNEREYRERSLHFVHHNNELTSSNPQFGFIRNKPANLTIACQFMPLKRFEGLEVAFLNDCIAVSTGATFTSPHNYQFDRIPDTYAHVSSWNNPVELYCEKPYILQILVLQGSFQVLPEAGEERETIQADTMHVLPFEKLLYALDRISKPVAVEDIPLSVDPDDYPVV